MVATRRLTELVAATLSRSAFPDGRLVVGLSGGADSAALAHLALAAGAEVRALHIDHGLPGSAMMSAAAEEVAGTLGIDLETVTLELGRGPSLEEQARDARYAVFDRIDGPVLTGHTRDDNAETVLLNLIRGTGPAGLAGIPPYRPPVVYRPILDVTRAETREISGLAGLAFRDDPMNDDPGLTRNRVRQQLLPLMSSMNPRVVDSIARTASAVRADVDFLDSTIDHIDLSGGLAASLVLTLPPALGDRLLARLLARSGVGVTSDRLARARDVAATPAGRQDLADGLTVSRRGALIVVE